MKLILGSISCIVLSIIVYSYFYGFAEEIVAIRDVTKDLESIFYKLDTDQNNFLDLNEFLTLKDTFTVLQRDVLQSDSDYAVQEFPSFSINFGEQILNIEVHYKPLNLRSLKKNISEPSPEERVRLGGLLNWLKPYKEKHPFGAKSFSSFLPHSNDVAPGFTWWIVNPEVDKYSVPLSSRRYFPPKLKDDNHLVLHALLSLFHPQAFIFTRFNPQGTVAIIRAVDDTFYDIIFRVHAEFQLNKPPFHPFWFTPSQFLGRLIINRDSSVIKCFEMAVPDTKLNVDMEWYNGVSDDSMEVDIGYIPSMSLVSSAISVPSDREKAAKQPLSSIQWAAEISVEAAIEKLEREMFPFKAVPYEWVGRAFLSAASSSKLVHGVVLWGNLADQSC